MRDDVLGLQALVGPAAQGFSGGLSGLADSLLQRKKMQQQQAQFDAQNAVAKQQADTSAAGEAAREAEAEGAARQRKTEFEAGAPERAANVERTTTETANAKADEGRKADDAAKKKTDDAIEAHVAQMLGDHPENVNDAQIAVQALKSFGPDVNLTDMKREIVKQRREIEQQGLSDAQKRAATGLTTAQTAEAYARANAAGKPKGSTAAADASGFAKSADDLIGQALDLADKGNLNWGPAGWAAEKLPQGVQSDDRQKLNSIMEQLTLEFPKLTNKTTRAPVQQELERIRSTVLPGLAKGLDKETFKTRLVDVRNRLADIAASEAAAPAPVAAKPSLATTLAGPSAQSSPLVKREDPFKQKAK